MDGWTHVCWMCVWPFLYWEFYVMIFYDILCLRFGAWKRWLTFHVEMGILIPEFND